MIAQEFGELFHYLFLGFRIITLPPERGGEIEKQVGDWVGIARMKGTWPHYWFASAGRIL